jgi:hypothetical protein
MKDVDLDRLVKSAAKTGNDESIEMPFGFDTRVVALWRANGNGAGRGPSAPIPPVALAAAAMIIVPTAGVYQQINQSRDLSEPAANEFAIADSVIQDEFVQ